MFKNEEGFSLLELVVAVGVAGIIAAVALPTFAGLQSHAQNTSATYAASASAAEALANSTLGNTGSASSNGGSTASSSSATSSSSQAPLPTISGLSRSVAGAYNNGYILWNPAVVSDGSTVVYTLTVTSTGELYATFNSTDATITSSWLWDGSFWYLSSSGFFAYSFGNHYGDLTVTATSANNPAVSQTVVF